MKTLNALRRHSMKALRAAHLIVLIASFLLSSVSDGIQIKLGSNMHVRAQRGSKLRSVGVLAAGSVVEIPDRFKVVRKGKVDADATFNKWLSEANFSKSEINRTIKNDKKDFYFPVKIVSLAAGSSGEGLKGKTRFMALRVLERSRGGLTVKKTSNVYEDTSLNPLRPVGAARVARPAPLAQPAEPAATSPAASEAPVETPVAPEPQTETPAAPAIEAPAAEPVPEPQVETVPAPPEETATAGEGCADCLLREEERARGNGGPSALTKSTREDILPALTDAETSGFQGLARDFPNQCSSSYIKSDGTYGPLGRKVLATIERSDSAEKTFLKAGGMGVACPNFNNPQIFTPARKKHFWVYLMTAVFAKESTCDPGARNGSATDGVGAGLGQMNEDNPTRRRLDNMFGDGQFCAGPVTSMYQAGPNIKCSMRRLEYSIEQDQGPFARNVYWSTLKYETRGLTRALISQYKACGAAAFDVPAKFRKGPALYSGSRSGTRSHRSRK